MVIVAVMRGGARVGQMPRKGRKGKEKDKKKESQRRWQEEEWARKWSPVSGLPTILVWEQVGLCALCFSS